MLQKKTIQNDCKIVTTKEGLETTNNDVTFVLEFQREAKALQEIGYVPLGLFQLRCEGYSHAHVPTSVELNIVSKGNARHR